MYLKCLNQDIEQRINMQTATSDYLQWKLSQRKEKRNQLNKESQNLILEHAELKFDPNKTITRYWRCNALSFRVTATFVFFSTGLNCSRLRRIGNIFIASSKCSGFSFSWAVNYDFDLPSTWGEKYQHFATFAYVMPTMMTVYGVSCFF